MTNSVYIFSGVVMPERAHLDMFEPIVRIGRNEGADLNFTIKMSIIKNQITVVLATEKKCKDVLTLRNIVTEFAYNLVDSVTLEFAAAHYVDIRTVFNLETETSSTFAPEVPALTKEAGKLHEFHVASLFDLVGREPLIGRALHDFRSAIERPSDTGFHCYRAYESILHMVGNEIGAGRKDKLKKIDALNERLCIADVCAEKLRDLSGDARHGEVVWISDQDRLVAIKIAKEIIERAAKYFGAPEESRPSFPLFELPTS